MDFDSDGITDLILGNRSGTVLFYKRGSDLSLQAGVPLSDNNGIIKMDNNSKPTIVDWNNDGLLDLFVSGGDTLIDLVVGIPIRFYLNEGTKENYKYGDYTEVQVNGENIEYLRCYTQIIDLNNDGLLDLIASEKVYSGYSSDSKIYFFENTGGSDLISLKEPKPLQYENGDTIKTGGDAHFCFADWNSDGVQDLLWTQYPGYTDKDYVYVSFGESAVDISYKKHLNNKDFAFSIKNNIISVSELSNILSITLYNISGQQIFTSLLKNNKVKLPSHLSNKIYLAKFKGISGECIKTIKIK